MGLLDFLDDVQDLIVGNKRFDSLKHFARSQDFQIRRKVKTEQLHVDVQRMEFFQGKRRRYIKGYLYKKDLEYESLNQIFDYYYDGDYGRQITTVYLFLSEHLDLPNFIIRPKSGVSKLGSIFTSSDWSTVNRDFDKSFSVESDDMNYMRMMITMQFAETMLNLGGYYIEGAGNYLVLYKKNAKTDIVEMDNVYDDGVELLDIIVNDYSNEII